ncbi:IS66-like element accessory protein TnpA [Labrys sp. KB_33_2]|uniref:IS66-like element accessory protein TnpA n=1 Tax=Labrys sp. KB_33_2 TaxID=3237479 RepID=UPI003F908DCF
MSRFDLTLDPERVPRRLEVINGAGGRRRWSADEKSQIVEETLAPGAIVSEIARRHGLRPQQVFGWRRDARIDRDILDQAPPSFVPAVIEASAAVPSPAPPPARRRRAAKRSTGGIELEIDGVVVRVGAGASAETITAVIAALKASP